MLADGAGNATLNTEALGLELRNVEFGLALMTQQGQPTHKWTSLQATAATVGFVGLGSDVTIRATDVDVQINQASLAGDAVVDYSLVAGSTTVRKTALSVPTSATSVKTLTLDGAKGKYMQASGLLDINLYGFVSAYGSLAVSKSSQNVKLAADTAGTTVNEATDGITVDVLTIGGKNLSAFAGVNGGYQRGGDGNVLADGAGNATLNTEALGLELRNVEFGLALMTQQGQPTHKWTSLQATAATVGFVGLGSDVTIRATDVDVQINQASLGR